ncbi:uncharacterized protein DUF3168 [Breoghania corrubedonensis]|uniref:Uncharacterized protein DUF3168 n=1 Tax=Breoghania corrubedonensis TaxID=665038 RepID=A0A2T5V1P6_9HYPH|nr:DUF3168 domain-containing protein [Breoghania corrubedonensis]PTW57656.1 uncharacterized protein DUF3168 [Breoghania corrubedonensis]
MTHAAEEMQAALVAQLRADAGLSGLLGEGRVEDGARRAAAYPNVAIGDWSARAIAGDDWPGEEHRLEFLVFSRAGGRKETLALLARLADLIDGAAITLAGHRLVTLARTSQTVTRTRDGRTWRGTLVYRAVTEPEGIA